MLLELLMFLELLMLLELLILKLLTDDSKPSKHLRYFIEFNFFCDDKNVIF